MSYFDDASLVMIPSGYKTSKVYSVKPTDGSGDLTFSRSNDTATRVNSAGLIEKVRTNRFTYSQDLSNAAWKTVSNGGSITKTANAGTAPDGTNTATRVQVAGGGTYSLVYQDGVNPLGSVVISGYFKRYGSSNQTFRLFGDNGSALSGTLTATDTWQRFSFAMNASSAGADGLAADASNNAYDILVWGMQLETGDIATDYIATTSSAVSVGPVANVPRLDYLGSSCPRLLLEPQRTNLVTYSDGLQVAQAFGATLTKNQITSPDGYVNASLLTPSGGAAGITLMTGSFSGNYTVSVYLKGTVAGQKVRAFGDLQGVIANFTLTTSWARYTATFNSTNAANQSIYLLAGSYFSPSENNPFYVYGAQVEAGAYATSYIPTLGAAVTRGADAASKTGISSLIGQTEGTLFVDFDFNGNYDSNGIVALDVLGAGSNEAYIFFTGGGQLRLELYVGGAIQALITSSVGAVGRKKIAFAYKANDFVGYMNGVQIGTDTSGTVGAMDTIYVGTYQSPTYATGNMNQTILFKTRLSNADLAALTTI